MVARSAGSKCCVSRTAPLNASTRRTAVLTNSIVGIPGRSNQELSACLRWLWEPSAKQVVFAQSDEAFRIIRRTHCMLDGVRDETPGELNEPPRPKLRGRRFAVLPRAFE